MAGLRCTVCDHEQREAIDSAIAVSSLRDIAKRFGVKFGAVWRHKETHLRPLLARALAARETVSVVAVQERLQGVEERARAIEAKLFELFKDGERQGIKHVDLARIAKEQLAAVSLIGKLTGELREGGTSITHDNRVQIAGLAGLTTDELRVMVGNLRAVESEKDVTTD